MKLLPTLILLCFLVTEKAFTQDTLYFRLSNPWNTVKSASGEYIRKCIKEADHYHVWDYNKKNLLVTESFYTDTNFTKKLFCHKYYDEKSGLLSQSRCYENGRLHGYFVSYGPQGDTTDFDVYQQGEVVKSWSAKPATEELDLVFVEEPAEFPGGRKAWYEYLGENLEYPRSARNLKGEVLLKFIISPKGIIETVEVIKSLHPSLDKEAIRVIKKSPRWKPARQNGKQVQTTMTMPIVFG